MPKTSRPGGLAWRTEDSGRQRALGLRGRDLVVIWGYQSGPTRKINNSDYLKQRTEGTELVTRWRRRRAVTLRAQGQDPAARLGPRAACPAGAEHQGLRCLLGRLPSPGHKEAIPGLPPSYLLKCPTGHIPPEVLNRPPHPEQRRKVPEQSEGGGAKTI